MATIIKRPGAERDLHKIWDYIALDNPAAATKLIQTIDAKFSLLAASPLMGRSRDEVTQGLHSFAVGNYVIFYRPLKDGIEVIRVLHGAQDVTLQDMEPLQ